MEEKKPIMSATQYAKMRGQSRQNIVKKLKAGKQLDGVKVYYKTGEKTSHYILIME